MNFGEKLQLLRKEKGFTQESLAEVLSVSRQAVSKWESGKSYPEMEKMIAISELFDITLDSLIRDSDNLDSDNLGSKNVKDPGEICSSHKSYRWSYEYKSSRVLFGLPLIHVNFGKGFTKAEGIIAIGNHAKGLISVGFISLGLISLGMLSVGLISFGVLALGLLALAAISIGIFSVGAIAVGIFTLGAISCGMFSIGALSIASHVAIGDHAYGHISVGRVVEGAVTFVDNSANKNFAGIDVNKVKEAIYTEFNKVPDWVVNFVAWFIR